MQQQSEEEAEWEFARGRAAIAGEDTLTALPHLEKALKLKDKPSWYSWLGYCIARERGQVRKGIELCLASLEVEPGNPDHYLNLGKVHLVAKNMAEALRVFREGMVTGGSNEILRKLEELGMRKPPVIPSLSRDNPVNKYLGLFLHRLGLR